MGSKLFSNYKLNSTFDLQNRIVMAPMTRSRAEGNMPNKMMEEYYGLRGDAGLIISEGTSPSPEGLGYARIPGLFNQAQALAWGEVARAAQKKGAKFFIQLMHTGRSSHVDNLTKGLKVFGPSPIAFEGKIWTDTQGEQPASTPTEMSESDIEKTIEQYVQAAKLAIEAGVDGIEIHGANGYLIDQFTNVSSNQRKDRWGGSVENRIRFGLEIAKRMSAAIGSDRVGYRISPYGVFNGMIVYPEMEETFLKLAEELAKLKLAYLHVVDHSAMGAPAVPLAFKKALKKTFGGTFIDVGGYVDAERAEVAITEGVADLIAYGRPFISNSNLVSKLREHKELTPPDFATFYTPGPKGYTDY